MINSISNNPFRTLGVYSNASIKDIVANKGKMNAFLKVGKQVSFPLDLTSPLGVINRTTDSITAADSLLTVENSKLNAAQFWFINVGPFDNVAFNHLSSGNIDAAVEIWNKKEMMSSLQNRAVCYLIKNDISSASKCLSILYDKYKDEFITAIGINREVSVEELVQGYITGILDSEPNVDFALLSNSECSNAWNNAAKGQMVQPLIKQLTDAIATSKQSKGKGPKARYDAGKKLNQEAKKLLFKLRKLLPNNDLQLISISDKVANEVLQCGIDYYNDSKSPYVAHDALELQKAASMFAMGSMAKERCKENCDILTENIKSLPPREVEQEHVAIQNALVKFCKQADEISYAVTLLNEVQGPLNTIKQKLGATNEYYIKRSSIVVGNALHNLIEEVNATQSAFNYAPNGSGEERNAWYRYKNSVESAWRLTQRLNSFAMDVETRKRFNENKTILQNLYNQIQSANKETSDNDNTWGSCLIQLLIYAGIYLLIRACNG